MTNDNHTTITEFVYQKLTEAGYQGWEANFETIINVIEELTIYYSDFNPENGVPSLVKTFFEARYANDLLNFSIEGGERKHGFKLQIPKNTEYPFFKGAYNNETPEQSFFIHLINDLLTTINNRISKYSLHTASTSNIITQKNEEINLLFTNWMTEHTQTGLIRMYTLNYDRLFKVLLERNNIPVFEGFDCGECIDYGETIKPNVPKILTDFDAHCHYNLHGSCFWDVNTLNNEDLPNYEITLNAAPILPVNNDPLVMQIEKGKAILVTPIITGYQKAQKAMLTPFKQMQASFDRDCSSADELYIIGYSFGDEHINNCIKTALQYNPSIRIFCVDPKFKANDLDLQCTLKIFPYAGTNRSFPKTLMPDITDKIDSFCNDRFWAYTMPFTDFLNLETTNNRYKTYKKVLTSNKNRK